MHRRLGERLHRRLKEALCPRECRGGIVHRRRIKCSCAQELVGGKVVHKRKWGRLCIQAGTVREALCK